MWAQVADPGALQRLGSEGMFQVWCFRQVPCVDTSGSHCQGQTNRVPEPCGKTVHRRPAGCDSCAEFWSHNACRLVLFATAFFFSCEDLKGRKSSRAVVALCDHAQTMSRVFAPGTVHLFQATNWQTCPGPAW